MPKRLRIKDETGKVIREYAHAISSGPGFTKQPKKEKMPDCILISVEPWEFTRFMIDNFLNDTAALEVGFDHALSENYDP